MEALKSSSPYLNQVKSGYKETIGVTYLVKVEVHGLEVDFQLGLVVLLFEKLHLCLSLLSSLARLKLLLCLSGLLLFLLVLLLLLVVEDLLLGGRDWLW